MGTVRELRDLIAAILRPENTALLVAAVNALPGLLDLWEAAAKDHHCVNEHWSWLDNPPHCPICAALDRIERA